MYKSYFGLTEAPFSIAPDPRYLYMSQRHQEALAHLLFGVNGEGGFVMLTGEIGAGKTTICRCLLEQIPPSCMVAYIFNPKLTVKELLSSICVEFGIDHPPGDISVKQFVDVINAYLLDSHARGMRAVLIIDEAQNLSADVLEQMRLLTNLETSQRKLLQIVLLGQPELVTMLAQPELRQLSQRIVARYHLGPLTRQEVGAYVQHRLEISGAQRQLFPPSLTKLVHRLTGGIPRLINVLCDRALLGTYVKGRDRVDRSTLKQSGREVIFPTARPRRRLAFGLSLGFLLLVVAVAVVWFFPLHESIATAAAGGLMEQSVATAPPRPAGEKPAPIVKAPVLPAFLTWPEGEERLRSMDMANTALLLAWGAHYEGNDLCRQAEGLGLRCRMGRGGLDELRQFNRPAILYMTDQRGQERLATLTALDADSATFSVGAKTEKVALGALAAQWSGRYTMLLRMPADSYRNVLPGQRGPTVQWMNKLLFQAQGREGEVADRSLYDAAMEREIRQFQLAEGLVPDGAIGPQTMMRLIGVADRTAPRLSGPGEG